VQTILISCFFLFYRFKRMSKQIDYQGCIDNDIYSELMDQIKEIHSDDVILNFLKRLDSYILVNKNIFDSRNVKVRNFKISIHIFISNFIKYVPYQIEFDHLINIVINDIEMKNKNESDYRPKFEKIEDIEILSKNILNELFSKDNPRELSELISKHFYDENEKKELFNCYQYFNDAFKNENENRMQINSFFNILKFVNFPHLNDYLMTLCIKLSLKLIESYTINFDDKLLGIDLINGLISKTSKSDLNLNNRTLLLLNNIERFMYDKDCIEFIYKLYFTQLKLLDIQETQYAVNDHEYSLHSKYFNILLNNCLMCSNLNIKIIYFFFLKKYLEQMNYYAVKYLSKLFEILLNDTIDYMKANIDYKFNYIIVTMIFSMIEICSIKFKLRIHQHAKTIIQFLVKFIYYNCLDYSEDELVHEKLFQNYDKVSFEEDYMHEDKYYCLKYCLKLIIIGLFKNEKVKMNEFKEFQELELIEKSKTFSLIINFIIKEINHAND
jgi:hypothetical protein